MTSLQRAGDPGVRPTLEELRQDTREVGLFLGFVGFVGLISWFWLVDQDSPEITFLKPFFFFFSLTFLPKARQMDLAEGDAVVRK